MQGGPSRGLRRPLPGLIAALIGAGGAFAQAPQPPEVRASESAPPFQIHVETNLVTVPVVVRDAQGRAVRNLRKEDFHLFEDGKEREITGFWVETTTEESISPPALAVPERFVALYFDDLHMSSAGIGPARDAALRFISAALEPGDRVAIFTSSNLDVVDFTSDRNKLHDGLLRLAGHTRTNALVHQCPAIGEYQAFLIAKRQQTDALEIAEQEGYHCRCEQINETADCRHSERINAQMLASQIWDLADAQSRQALDVLDGIVSLLAARPGQRDLVLVSAGFLSATRTRAVDAVVDRALRRNIVVNALDSAGLYTRAQREPLLATRPDLEMRKFGMENEGLTAQRDVLSALAAGTGGTYFHNSNDFDAGLRQTAEAPGIHYVLSFSPGDVKPDGKFHALKVTLAAGDRLQVEARRGYFATPPAAPVRSALETLMFSQDARQDLPTAVTTINDASGVKLKIHVDIRDLQFRKQTDRNLNTLIFDTALFDRDGKYVAGKESSLELQLTDTKFERLRQSGIDAETSFHVPPGTYRVREVVRDAESTKLSAMNCNVEVSAQPVQPAAAVEPAANQDRLPLLLANTGQNVKLLFEALPAISAREQVTLDRIDGIDHARAEFRYLDLPHTGMEAVGRDEYRANAAGQRVGAEPLEGGLITKGFASILSLFDPLYQPESTFRYVGRQNVDGHVTDVVAFTQIPSKARVTQALTSGAQALEILVKGLAWIDAENDQILRMRTELLAPVANPDLQAATTELRFGQVQLQGIPQTFWLPAEATVTLKWRGATFRNIHAYSDYELFQPNAASPVLLARFKEQVRQALSQVHNYTCLETIDRSVRGRGEKAFSRLDTVLLEVSNLEGKELLSWPGARQFRDSDPSSFVNQGLMGTGVFALQARTVFQGDHAVIQYHGNEDMAGRPVARFDFRVPKAWSGYQIRTYRAAANAGTSGSFWVDPASLELVRMEVRADEVPPELGVQLAATAIDYAPMRIGDSPALLPQAATTLLALSSGEAYRNEIQFSHCREYQAESAVRFDVQPPPALNAAPQTRVVDLPAGLTMAIQLETAIDSATAHVGDLLRGHVVNDVRRKGKTMIPAGALVTGRIRGLERSRSPQAVTTLTIEIAELEWDHSRAEFYGEMLASEPRHDGGQVLLNLPVKDGGMPEMPVTANIPTQEAYTPQAPGTGILQIPGTKFHIGAGLRTNWRTLEPNARLKKSK